MIRLKIMLVGRGAKKSFWHNKRKGLSKVQYNSCLQSYRAYARPAGCRAMRSSIAGDAGGACRIVLEIIRKGCI